MDFAAPHFQLAPVRIASLPQNFEVPFGHRMFMLLLAAPAVEVEADGAELTGLVHDEHRSGIAHPQVVDRLNDQIDRRAAQARGDVVILFAYQHLHRFVCGNGLGYLGQIMPGHWKQPFAP